MRIKAAAGDLSFQAVAGTHVVTIGWSLPEATADGLLGFAVHKTDHKVGNEGWLSGMKTFAQTDPGRPAGTLFSTREQPIQSFLWADYDAEPGRTYTYRLVALKGTPADLIDVAEATLTVTTEAPEGGANDVHFNCGIASSQQFARHFGNRPPDDMNPADPAWFWLSRGLLEALRNFVDAAEAGDKLRICAYEFHYLPFLRVLRNALDRGVDVKIIYDAKGADDEEVFPRDANRAAVAAAGLGAVVTERREARSAISHNKFIVRFKGAKPVAVWTGGTNFSAGGIFGQSNVGEVAESDAVASRYADYWALLAEDPTAAALRPKVDALSPTPDGLPKVGTTVIFSPRGSLDVLEWYAARAMAAKDALFMTFAFGMHPLFQDVYANGSARLRFALMEKEVGTVQDPVKRAALMQRMRTLRLMEANLFGIGSHLREDKLGTWLAERLTELNSHVRYVHNKFMLIDPLGDDPIVVSGSANFSDASTQKNDENMLITRGDTRVADIYLCEFMRLYNHHAFRDFLTRSRGPVPTLNHLRTDDWWRAHYGDADRSRRRTYFAGIPFDL